MTAPAYATVEQLAAALDVDPSGHSTSRMLRALQTASRYIDEQLHRHFYPLTATYTYSATPTSPSSGGGDRLELHAAGMWLNRDLLSLTSATEDGTAVTTGNVTYRPSSAPYNWASLTGSVIAITGVWGYTNDTEAAGALDAAISDTTGTTITVTDSSIETGIGIGDLITIDSERFYVSGSAMADTTANVTANLTAQMNDVTVTVNDGTLVKVGETILVDSERMLITDISSNTLTVVRAVDGTTLAAHTQPIDVYARRTLTVERGAAGSTAATHTDTTAITRNKPPEPIKTLAIAEAIMTMTQEPSGYGRTTVSGAELATGLDRAWEAARQYQRLRMAAI